ncbi:MAG: hypothetical protein A2156_12385 [Deltaproteobacteria bacterium RBG_16_48_10]|nr:MAG: hypothetical protein A2156_12385 [Deltaproteobacteria bacterium RBG_16_48_10]
MPILHKYKKRNMYYIFTEIKGKIIAFQLTHDGERKLKSAGIFPGKTFGRAILLDLYRSGDAYTYGRGLDHIEQEFEPHQLEFDFAKDPDPESLFPLCAICSSPDDLHLVEIKSHNHYASLLCADCRTGQRGTIDTSIPLSLVTRAILKRILEIKHIEKKDSSVSNYQVLLDAEFKNRWDTSKKRKKTRQEKLFETENA